MLSASLCVKDNTKRRGHEHALLVWVVKKILARTVALVPMYEVDLVLLVGRTRIFRRFNVRSLDSSFPRLACHELITNFRSLNEEFIIAGKLIRRLLLVVVFNILALFYSSGSLEPELLLVHCSALQAFHVRKEVPFLVFVRISICATPSRTLGIDNFLKLRTKCAHYILFGLGAFFDRYRSASLLAVLITFDHLSLAILIIIKTDESSCCSFMGLSSLGSVD